LASNETEPNAAAAATAKAVARQLGLFVDVQTAPAGSAWHFLLIMRTIASGLDCQKDHNIKVLA
jgi:hypothetical protein